MKPILVGECNPYSRNPRHALYPHPPNSAGGRLCFKVMGLTLKQYIRSFERVNLCANEWSKQEAEVAAAALMRKVDKGASLILLGYKVCAAFDLPYQPFSVQWWPGGRGRAIVVLPHPSGRCRVWNDSSSYERARAALHEAEVLP